MKIEIRKNSSKRNADRRHVQFFKQSLNRSASETRDTIHPTTHSMLKIERPSGTECMEGLLALRLIAEIYTRSSNLDENASHTYERRYRRMDFFFCLQTAAHLVGISHMPSISRDALQVVCGTIEQQYLLCSQLVLSYLASKAGVLLDVCECLS